MLKLLTLFLCCYGALAAPTILQSRPLVQNAETRFANLLPGVRNLEEKSIPVAKVNSGLPVTSPGKMNLKERMQIQLATLPGLENLVEKAISEAVILRMAESHPESEYESI